MNSKKLRCRVRPLEPWEPGYPYYKETADFWWEECDINNGASDEESDNKVDNNSITSKPTHRSS